MMFLKTKNKSQLPKSSFNDGVYLLLCISISFNEFINSRISYKYFLKINVLDLFFSLISGITYNAQQYTENIFLCFSQHTHRISPPNILPFFHINKAHNIIQYERITKFLYECHTLTSTSNIHLIHRHHPRKKNNFPNIKLLSSKFISVARRS